MRLAETVTFGGSGFDHATEIRARADEVAALLAAPNALATALWRGKPLLMGPDTGALGWLPPGHAIFTEARAAPVFLGRDAAGGRFAFDISPWEPADTDETQIGAFFDPSEQHHPSLPDGWRFAELRGVMARLSPEDAELAATARALFSWHGSHGFCPRCGVASDVTLAGWQRRCPACGGMHFPRTDPVVIMLVTRANSVLLGRSPNWPARMYSLLAGFMEPGETIEAAVRREVAEETGVRIGQVGYLASQPWPFPCSLMIGCHGRAESREITLDDNELEDARWLTREDVANAFAGTHPDIDPARKGSIAHFLLFNWLADRLD